MRTFFIWLADKLRPRDDWVRRSDLEYYTRADVDAEWGRIKGYDFLEGISAADLETARQVDGAEQPSPTNGLIARNCRFGNEGLPRRATAEPSIEHGATVSAKDQRNRV